MKNISQYLVLFALLVLPPQVVAQTQELSSRVPSKMLDWNYFPIPKVGTKRTFVSLNLQGKIKGMWEEKVTSVEREKGATLVTFTMDQGGLVRQLDKNNRPKLDV